VFNRFSMRPLIRLFLIVGLCFSLGRSLSAAEPHSRPLIDYIKKTDSSYHWTKVAEGTVGQARYVEIVLTSQTWKDTVWKHQLFIFKPKNVDPAAKEAILMIAGGDWDPKLEKAGRKPDLPEEAPALAFVADQLREPVALIKDVPFQPIFQGKVEDQIIAYTFDMFLKTGLTDWPLLLPMVKSAVRAMDTVQAFAKKEWSLNIEKFTVTGASKRGWTTWLTGAADPRVAGIVPIVIDTPAGDALRAIVDPYSYLDMLKLPKLLMMGTNDPYWPLEAASLYWNDLLGEKYLLYVPNNGHNLQDLKRIVGDVVAFQEHVAQGKRLAKMKWNFKRDGSAIELTVESDLKPKSVVAWTATAKTRDFRESKWTSQPTRYENGSYHFELPVPAEGCAAVFGEATFPNGIVPYFLSTNVRIVSKSDKTPEPPKTGR
jgi:PhoPQ-activated pathogenicity-related protein